MFSTLSLLMFSTLLICSILAAISGLCFFTSSRQSSLLGWFSATVDLDLHMLVIAEAEQERNRAGDGHSP
ncbi:hypothetical protein M758_4G093000 [Ceratodon purpureus]|nr:hypothetical protein M758_4G093000 [Ceratodon purpureus]